MNDEWLEDFCSEDKSVLKGCAGALGFIAILMACILIFGSCKSVKYVRVPEVHTDTLFITKQQRDSIWLHDSVFVKEYTKGDTVYLMHDRWHTKYVESIKFDSIYISKCDTIAEPYPVEVKVEKQLTKWQRLRMRLGDVMLGLVGLLFVYGIFKLKRFFMP